jgi:hypothetical protein
MAGQEEEGEVFDEFNFITGQSGGGGFAMKCRWGHQYIYL